MASTLLTIIIPVRSEEKTIRTTLAVLQKTVHTPFEIVIADDSISSADTTVAIVKKLHNPHIRIVEKTSSDADGFGPSLVRAICTVKTPYTLFVMADMSDDPGSIDQMVHIAQAHAFDIVCGCRYMKNAQKIGGPKLQGILSHGINGFLFYGCNVLTRDATNAFKLYKTSFLKTCIPKDIESGVEFSLQLFLVAQRNQPKVLDVPTIWRGREQGQSKVRLMARGPRYLILIWQFLVHNLSKQSR